MWELSSSDTDREDQAQPEVETSSVKDPMMELRRLILEPEQEKIETLEERLTDPDLYAKDLSKSLPKAILLSAKEGNQLTTALLPTVAEIIKISVKKDLSTFVDALFPVMGPAIRKAIAESFKQMIQSLNTALEQSFSLQGLKWRFEAARTGKSFAEIALLHSLVYRVEQVFLIQRESGILIQHASSLDEAFQDADLVSAMLTAIQDFVHDSFSQDSEGPLETVQMGEITLWIEQGPKAILAGAIRGNAPEEFRLKFKDALESIHLEKQKELEQFEGDATLFDSTQPYLEACLDIQVRQKKKKVSLLLPLIVIILIAGLGSFGYLTYREKRHQAEYLSFLGAQKGIVVTSAETRSGRLIISGLRDPLANSPETLVAQSKLSPKKVVHQFKPYQALHPDFVLQRARQSLRPPASVTLTLNNGILNASGDAPYQWILDARTLLPALSGIQQLNEDNLANADLRSLSPPATVDFYLKEGHLTARGKASNAWIRETRKHVLKIEGIDRYSDSEVVNLDAAELASIRAKLEGVVVRFQFNTTGHTPEQTAGMISIRHDIQRFIDLAISIGKDPFVEIIGHTDRSGSEQRSLELSLARADYVKDKLVSDGIRPEYLSAVGVGWKEPVKEEITDTDKEINRSVTLRLHLDGPHRKGF